MGGWVFDKTIVFMSIGYLYCHRENMANENSPDLEQE